MGHGGEIGLSSEKLLKLTDVNGWANLNTMPLFVTITCEFTRLDDPKRTSAGEQLALNPNGGSIGLISTTRTVFAVPAIRLNKAVFRTMFERPNNQPKTFGQIIRDAKNLISDNSTKLKFSLIGDPAVRLAIPYYRLQTNTINGQDVSVGNLDTIQALSKVTITGQVNDFNDQKLTGFSGIANVSMYDKASNKKTKVNDGVGSPLNFTQRNNLIYRGKVQVTQGDFSFTFIVPKDICAKIRQW
ncbi:MAG: C25 family cysteine peptidase [Owenweeksia sp.]|nr:C25 family cysteine peptidase [Owenweeksia sp.]